MSESGFRLSKIPDWVAIVSVVVAFLVVLGKPIGLSLFGEKTKGHLTDIFPANFKNQTGVQLYYTYKVGEVTYFGASHITHSSLQWMLDYGGADIWKLAIGRPVEVIYLKGYPAVSRLSVSGSSKLQP